MSVSTVKYLHTPIRSVAAAAANIPAAGEGEDVVIVISWLQVCPGRPVVMDQSHWVIPAVDTSEGKSFPSMSQSACR